MQLNQAGLGHIPTVYIGGGTPSVLGPSGIEALLAGLKKFWGGIQGPSEITVEANPESASEGFLKACRDGGVTRLSLGIQTLHEPSRWAVGRVGAVSAIQEGLGLAQRIFGADFSVDLITGLPFQDESVLLRDIATVLSYEPGHVSLYALTVEPGTPLASAQVLAEMGLMDADREGELWIAGRDALESRGYGQYEVSNFARPGKESRHNIRYWRMENWLGLGPGASGTLIDDAAGRGVRLTVAPAVEAYLGRLSRGNAPERISEALDRRILMEETLLMGFRYREGPDPVLFRRRFGVDIEACIPPPILDRWSAEGLLQSAPLALTPAGLLHLNAFLAHLLSTTAS
jgi:oxygen-independent coproporphyrinogen-3 oxidase